MRNPTGVREIISYYDGLLDKHGDDPQSVGWSSTVSQRRKFFEIAGLFAHEKLPFTVYDVGCGIGHLHDFLAEINPLARYYGCDINPRMIEMARRRIPPIEIACRNILRTPPKEKYDYAVACGTFNTRLKTPRPVWAAYVRDMMRMLYRIARKGIAVDFLSSFAEGKLTTEYYQDPSEILDFVQRRLSPLAEIRHSSSPGHFAVFAYRWLPAESTSRLRGPSLKSRSTIDSFGVNEP
jgi:SAM-dependent methyltransferase